MQHTFGTQMGGMLVYHQDVPAPQFIHNVHYVLALGGETCDSLALNDRIVGNWIDYAREDGWSMTDGPHDSATRVYLRSNSLKTVGIGIID